MPPPPGAAECDDPWILRKVLLAAAATASAIRRLDAASSTKQLSKAARRGIEPAAALHVQAASLQEDVRRLQVGAAAAHVHLREAAHD